MRKMTFALFCVCVLLIQSCQKVDDFRSVDSVNHHPEFAVPLINTSLSLDEALEEIDDISFLKIDPDGSMTFNYTQDTIQKRTSDLIQEIEDFPIALVDSFISVQLQLFDNLAVTNLHLKTGTISFDIQSSHTEDINLNIIFPGMTKNGVPFEMTRMIQYQGDSPVSANIAAESVEGFDLAMPGGNLEIRYEAYNTSGARVMLDIVHGEAKDWTFSSVEGVWATESFVLDNGSIKIDLFESWVEGQVSFEDPKLKIDLTNSIGIPMQIKFQNLVAHTTDGNDIPITSVFDEGYNISYPALNEMGQEKTNQIIFDKNNSNIISVFNARPEFITYEIIAVMNPENTTETGFISENSALSGSIGIEVPVFGTAAGFTIETGSEFSIDKVEEISHVEFKLITLNEIPLDLGMQLYFTDEAGTVIDSLFEEQETILAGPATAANGTVLTPSEQINIIAIPEERLDKIQTATQIITKASLSTSNSGMTPVQIFTNQKVVVKMGAIFGLE